MASQYGKTRLYGDISEDTSPRKVMCDRCKVLSVPRGVQTNHVNITVKQETYCPNCGHIHRAGVNKDNH